MASDPSRLEGVSGAEQAERGGRDLFVDDISDATLADPATAWQSADNYNASHPFNAIDRLSVAIT